MKKNLLIILCTGMSGLLNAQDWNTMGSGVSHDIRSFAVDTIKNVLYAGGDIDTADGIQVSHVVKWDGVSWTNLGLGFDEHIDAVKIYDNELWVSGDFTMIPGGSGAGYIAKYNDTTWMEPGGGLDSFAFAMESLNDTLYVAGDFNMAGSISANKIAGWDGSSWFSLGAGLNGPVNTLAVYNGELYAGGGFDSAGGAPANYIARWNGTSWSALGSGTDFRIYDLAVYNGELYVAGQFTTAGGVPSPNIAKWDGTNWSTVGGGATATSAGYVLALSEYNGNLYAGGNIDLAGGVPVNDLAQWNGTTWADVSGGISGGPESVTALGVFRDELIVAGFFDTAGVIPANNVARWTAVAPVADFMVSDSILCLNDCVNFFDQSTGGPTSYNWTFQGGNPSTSTTQHPTVCYDTAGVYDVQLIVSNSLGADTLSMTAYIQVNSKPTPMVTPTVAAICSGDSVMISTASNTGSSYQWYLNNSPVAGATSNSTYATVAGDYFVQETNASGCSANSDTITVTNSTSPSMPVINRSGNNLVATNGPFTYQWYLNGALIPGANSNTYTPVINGMYVVVISNSSGCSATSNPYAWTLTSVEEVSILTFRVFPNPASEILTLVSGLNENTSAKILDIAGKEVKSITVIPGRNEINLNGISNGTYFITGNGSFKPVKFFVVK